MARFLQMAMGSASELEYHLLLGGDLGLLERPDYEQLAGEVTEVKRMLTSFIHKLKASVAARGRALMAERLHRLYSYLPIGTTDNAPRPSRLHPHRTPPRPHLTG